VLLFSTDSAHMRRVYRSNAVLQILQMMSSLSPNHALQRTRQGVAVGNRGVPCAGSLSLGR
jgi:hypothetical protein